MLLHPGVQPVEHVVDVLLLVEGGSTWPAPRRRRSVTRVRHRAPSRRPRPAAADCPHRHGAVGRAVLDQDRRIVRRDVGDGVGRPDLARDLGAAARRGTWERNDLPSSALGAVEAGGAEVAVGAQERDGAVPVDDGLEPCPTGPRSAGSGPRRAATSPDVPASAARLPPADWPQAAKRAGSSPYSAGVGAQPADGGLDVADGRRERAPRRSAGS